MCCVHRRHYFAHLSFYAPPQHYISKYPPILAAVVTTAITHARLSGLELKSQMVFTQPPLPTPRQELDSIDINTAVVVVSTLVEEVWGWGEGGDGLRG